MIENYDYQDIISINNEALMFFKRKNINNIYLSIKPSGCSGFSYTIEETNNDDINNYIKVDLRKDNFNIYIHKTSLNFYNGTKIELKKTNLEEKIVFINPNIKNSCGCGESFNI